MLRAVVALLLLANLLFFAWARGWLGEPPRHAEREPGRLAAQTRPEAITVLSPGSANVAVQAARAAALACLEAGPFKGESAQNDLGVAEALLVQAQVPASAWTRIDPSATAVWLVFAGRYPEAQQRNTREEELRKLNLSYERIDTPADLAPGFVLSRHGSRDDAEAWLKNKAPAALRGARVVQLPAPPPSFRLRVPQADADMAERMRALPADLLAGGFKPCAAKP